MPPRFMRRGNSRLAAFLRGSEGNESRSGGPAATRSGRNRTRPHGEKAAREKLEKERLRGRSGAFPAHRDGLADVRRTEARRFGLETPGERRGRSPAAHLHLDSGPRALLHSRQVSGALCGSTKTPRGRSRIGQETAGRHYAVPGGKQRHGEIEEQDAKEHPGGGKTCPRPQMIPLYGLSAPHGPVSVFRFQVV